MDSKQLHIRIRSRAYNELRELADYELTSISLLVRRAIDNYLKIKIRKANDQSMTDEIATVILKQIAEAMQSMKKIENTLETKEKKHDN